MIPITVLCGFLGSGKTTLLRQWRADEAMRDAAVGWWRAELALNRNGKLLPQEVEHLRERMRTADPVFGDRHNELTLIGLPTARHAFAQTLHDCLCTEEEVRAWQNGAAFEDPWPATMRQQG